MSANSESAAIVAGFLKFLDQQGKRHLLPEVIGLLQKQIGPKLPELIVESAIELSASDRQNLTGMLADKERDGEIKFRVNPELIGGFKVIHGDRVLDLSVLSKLNKIYA
jgi:F0F1-type ATP synthase delta subunit